jgi:hypothetical protein
MSKRILYSLFLDKHTLMNNNTRFYTFSIFFFIKRKLLVMERYTFFVPTIT